MIVVDLDGTILNSNKKVSDATKKYFKMLKNQGYIIVVVTGRIYSSALKTTDGAEFINFIISDNGSCIYDTKDATPIYQNEINKDVALKILNNYNEKYRYIDVCDKNIIYKYSDEIEDNSIIQTTKDKNYILNSCEKISHMAISMQTNEMVSDLYHILIAEFKDLDIVLMQDSFADRKWLEILPNGCSKYNGIRKLANYLKISNDSIICFGDGLNDVDMLQKCGYGVAMKNALDEVKNVVKNITKFDHNNDGVIRYLMEKL